MPTATKDEIRNRREEIALRARSGDLALPEAVKDMREALGMTQAVFAKHFGLTRGALSKIENGKANPSLETLTKICKPFGFRVGFVPVKR